jgi:hypothetical protein
VGHLSNIKPAKEAKLHDLALARRPFREGGHGLIQIENVYFFR